MALEIAQCAKSHWQGRAESVHFLEPAVGTGAFYFALRKVFSRESLHTATGVEIDLHAARTASRLWRSSGLRVVHGDFTHMPPLRGRKFNLLLTNPPYVRHHHLNRADKLHFQQRAFESLGLHVNGLAGLYVYYLLLAHEWLADGGLSIWLIPSEFMDVNYGRVLRQYFTERISLLRIHRFHPGEGQFPDALVSSAIVVFAKERPRPDHRVMFSYGGTLARPAKTHQISIDSLDNCAKWTSLLRRPRPLPAVHEPSTSLGELFDVTRGLATGANRFFVLPRKQAEDLGIPEEYLRPILPGPRHLQHDIVESASDGYPRIEIPLALIDCRVPEEKLRERCKRLWAYVQHGRTLGIHNRYLLSRRTPWYSQERRPPAPFLCTYMGRSVRGASPFRFLWNKSQATAANVYLLLYPKGPMLDAMEKNRSIFPVVFDCLNAISSDSLTSEGRVYGGGLFKLEPGELARLPAGSLDGILGCARPLHASRQAV